MKRENTYIILHGVMYKHLVIISYRYLCESGVSVPQCLLYTASLLQTFTSCSRLPTVSEEKLGSNVMFARPLHICMSPGGFVQNTQILTVPEAMVACPRIPAATLGMVRW